MDGGYYLFAGRAPIAKNIWTSVTYSAADTAEQLLTQLPAPTALLDCITDVDTVEDLAILERELQAGNPTNSTNKVLIDYIVKEFK